MTAAATFLHDNTPHHCGACGSRLSGRWERLTPGLCGALVKFYVAICAKGKNELHLQNECDLTKSEYCNFPKLRYFALAVRVDDKPGHWLLTWRGRDFIRNTARVPRKVFIFQNRIQERSPELVSIAEVMRSEPFWLQKSDYVVFDAVPQGQLF